MKNIFLIILVFGFLIGPVLADRVTIPKYIQLSDPTTNQVERVNVDLFWGPPAYAVLTYWVVDSRGRTTHDILIKVQNEVDDPNSITFECVAENDPWPLCTGAGTCENDCDETTTDFTDFTAGFISTLNDRATDIMWEDVQERFILQDNP